MDQNTSRKAAGISEVIRAFVLSALLIMLAFMISWLILVTESDAIPDFS